MAPPTTRRDDTETILKQGKTSRIYRSNQTPQQARFPTRRKVVKKHGRHDTRLSPKQRTLTQIGYSMRAAPEIHEIGILDHGLEASIFPSGRQENLEESSHVADISSPLTPGYHSKKRQKVRHQAASVESVAASYHTQTLTQLVSKHTHLASEIYGEDCELDAMVQDSEDEDTFVLSPPKNGLATIVSVQHGGGCEVASPRRKMCASQAIPNELPSTPAPKRTEIPSSQPSPFTPLSHEGGAAHMGAVGEIPDSDEEGGCEHQSSHSPYQYLSQGRRRPARHSGGNETSPVQLLLHQPLNGLPVPTTPALQITHISSSQSNSAGAPESNGPVERVLPAQCPVHREAQFTATDRSTTRPMPCPFIRQRRRGSADFWPSNLCQEILPASSRHDTDAEAPMNTQHQYSQNLESQRVSLETIRSLGPQTDRSDIIISIHPEQIHDIISGTKDHEFRDFNVPHTVCRFWMYATWPVCELQYMAVIAGGSRMPGNIDDESGIGNADFNAGRLVAKFAYKLAQVYQLNDPVSLDVMKQEGWGAPPSRYNYLPPTLVGYLLGNLRCALFEDIARPVQTRDDRRTTGEVYDKYVDHTETSLSQEIEAQLFCDIMETQTFEKQERPIRPNLQAKSVESISVEPTATPIEPHETNRVVPSRVRKATRPSRATTMSAASIRPQISTIGPFNDQLATIMPRTTPDPNALCTSYTKDTAGEAVNLPSTTVYPTSMNRTARTRQARRTGHGPQKEARVQRSRGARSSSQTAMTLSSYSTQAALPDSLFEEVRQAPPVVIVDSEESDNE